MKYILITKNLFLKNMNKDELKSLMCIPADAKDVKYTFAKIADIIENYCVIRYNEKRYRIIDFEFYFYNKMHQDITVHPRNSEALCWYINEFGGIDLNFESKNIEKTIVEKKGKVSFKYKMEDNSYYGGILIRQIQDVDNKTIFDGPLKVAELFRILDATSQNQNNPVLEIDQSLEKINFANKKRHNLLGSKKDSRAKVDYNVKEWFTEDFNLDKGKLIEKLDILKESEDYRFCYIPKP